MALSPIVGHRPAVSSQLLAVERNLPTAQAVQRFATGLSGLGMGVAAESGSALDRLETRRLVDRRSDAHFAAAVVGCQRLRSEYPAAAWLASIVEQHIRAGLALDELEDEHADAAGTHVGKARAGGRAITSTVEAALTCSGCGRAACRCSP